jgi:DNA-directed RNA polymerase subunit RPC12/RpoP
VSVRQTTPVDFCENCGETRQLAKIKGCIRCLRCGFKADCSGM